MHTCDLKDPRVLGRWAAGMRGAQLWECLFEMEVYLRLSRVGAKVTLGEAAGEGEASLEFNGCHAEVYSPIDADALVMGTIVSMRDQATDLIERVRSGIHRRSLGERETVMIIECPPLMYASVMYYKADIQRMLAKSGQPSGVLFVQSTRHSRREHCFVPNPAAAVTNPPTTKDAMDRAMNLDLLAIMALDSGKGNTA